MDLSSDERDALRRVISTLLINDRTGHLGVAHGLDRFVSTGVVLKKQERDALDRVAAQLGASVRHVRR